MAHRSLVVGLIAACLAIPCGAQSGRQSASERGKEVIHLIAQGDGSGTPITVARDSFDLYDGGTPQTIETMQVDQSAVRLVLLVDNSKTLKVSVDDVKSAAHALVGELYKGDSMMIVGFEETAYILQDYTTNLDALDATAETKFRKQGLPKLFDALSATVSDAFGGIGNEKRILVLLADGYDEGSKEKFDDVLDTLQRENIVVYVVQAPDRTRNASRLNGPKPLQAVAALAEKTGGRVFPLSDLKTAAKTITEEVRVNWYRVVYTPRGVDRLSERNILIMRRSEDGPILRTKASFPAHRSARG